MSVKALAISCWLVVAALLAAVCFFSGRAEAETSRSTGYINDGTRICEFNVITHNNVDLFETYNTIIDKLEDVGIGGLTQDERMLGAFLMRQEGCGTVAMDYRVVISSVDGDYALFFFDLGYGFETIVYLMRLSAFHADELL